MNEYYDTECLRLTAAALPVPLHLITALREGAVCNAGLRAVYQQETVSLKKRSQRVLFISLRNSVYTCSL